MTEEKIKDLKAGDKVLLSGTIYTARDAAHKRIVELIDKNEKLPFDLKDACIYFVGPTPTKPGQKFGSGGPTTSGRMDKYSPILLDLGLKGMIGKGYRDFNVKQSIIKNKGIYFGAIGGTGAIISKCITNCEIIAFEDLGAEAVRKLEIEKMPLTVIKRLKNLENNIQNIIDSKGNDLYEIGKEEYLKTIK